MTDQTRFRYDPADEERLSMAIARAVAAVHNEEVREQSWTLADDINPDALDTLFSDGTADMRLTFEANGATVTVDVDEQGQFSIEMESHR